MNTNDYYKNYSDDDLINIYDDFHCELSELDSDDDYDEYSRIEEELSYIENELERRDI